jgi:aspartate-semialdehyde dehydrogenase
MSLETCLPHGWSRRLRVGLLGCTGAVGQQFIRLLHRHAWFDLVAVAASDRSAGSTLGNVCAWKLAPTSTSDHAATTSSDGVPEAFADLVVLACNPCDFVRLGVQLVFSALATEVAQQVEPRFIAAGISVFRYCVLAMQEHLQPQPQLQTQSYLQ